MTGGGRGGSGAIYSAAHDDPINLAICVGWWTKQNFINSSTESVACAYCQGRLT